MAIASDFELDPSRRESLMTAGDEIGLTLTHDAEIAAYEAGSVFRTGRCLPRQPEATVAARPTPVRNATARSPAAGAGWQGPGFIRRLPTVMDLRCLGYRPARTSNGGPPVPFCELIGRGIMNSRPRRSCPGLLAGRVAAIDPDARCAAPARQTSIAKHNAESVPNVLDFEAELVRDGRTLEHPVNYGLVRIVPPKGMKIDADRRPFIVVDPRAGHGPGIGGMKKESEIGQVLEAGHPCYFVGYPAGNPLPGRRSSMSGRRRRNFVEDVASRHPDAEGKPGGDRQLSGRLADHDHGRDQSGRWPDRSCSPARRSPTGPASRQESDALHGRPSRRHLDGLHWPATWAAGRSTARTWLPISSR
jgi:hypothetical protein